MSSQKYQISQIGSSEQFIKFIVATDNHLGANENGGLKTDRYHDSFEAFEEVLKLAQTHKVDFVLLGGDLFHEKRPSEHCLLKCVDILQRYVFGNSFGGISMEAKNYKPNFSSSNFNVQLPIFIINGNHDNFISEQDEHVSILDILHESKYLNYFGKVTNQAVINVQPLIILKNNIKIALYGIGYVKDYQFSKLLATNKVILEELDERNFNILVIHQNRYKGTHFQEEKDFLDPIQFRKFGINLLIWGHEHEPKVLEPCEHFQTFQAGSTVATSFIEAESLMKQAGLFQVAHNSISFESLKLIRSHRPMIIKSIELSELVKRKSDTAQQHSLQELAERRVFDVVDSELKKHYGESPYREKKPILRIKIEYSGFELMKIRYLETKFADKVANPDKIFQFWEKKQHIQQQQERRKLEAKKMDDNFNEILTNKQFTMENDQIIADCSMMVRQQLDRQSLKILQVGDVMQLLDSFTNKQKMEKGNVFESLQNQLLQRHTQTFYPSHQQRLQQLVKQQKETEDSMIMEFRQQVQCDFTMNCKNEISLEKQQYQLTLNKNYDQFLEALKSNIVTQAVNIQAERTEANHTPNMRIQTEPHREVIQNDDEEDPFMQMVNKRDIPSKPVKKRQAQKQSKQNKKSNSFF